MNIYLLLFIWRMIVTSRENQSLRRRQTRRRIFQAIQQQFAHRRLRLLQNTAAFLYLQLCFQQLTRRHERRFWTLPRPQIGWFEIQLNSASQTMYWKEHFRMRKDTFQQLVALVGPELERENTRFRQAVPVSKRVAISLWRLGGGSSYREIAAHFDVGKSTCVKITNEFCRALNRLANRFIKFPSTMRETSKAIAGFQQYTTCQLPQVVGALDGTHITITAPVGQNPVDYFDREHNYSVILQAVVGEDMMFLDTAMGYPGSMHDARVLRCSDIFRRAENNDILKEPVILKNNCAIRPFLIADGAYPLLPWLMKPYRVTANITPVERRFNAKLSSSRSVVERAFGSLKARWRILLKRLDVKFCNISDVILTCCILHNFCQLSGDHFDDQELLRRAIMLERRYARARPHLNIAAANSRVIRTAIH